MAGEDDRRSESRRNLNLQVEYPDRQGYPIDITESVSSGGIFIRSSQHHRIGEELRLAVSLPGFPDSLSVTGVVARIREATANQPRGVGLQIAQDEYVAKISEVMSSAESREFSLSTGPYAVLAALPRVRLATTPTPLHRAERLSKELGGPEIWFKRDDLTGFALGGNKVRKMEFIAADALQARADTLVIGAHSPSSNQIRISSAVAARLGLKAVAVVAEGADESTGVGELFETQIRPLENPALSLQENIAACMAQLEASGRRPYAVSDARSSWLSAAGYMLASIELITQLRRLQLRPEFLLCPVGSAETMSGLVLTQRWLDCSYDVLGISVAESEQWCSEQVANIGYDLCSALNIADTIPVDDIWINDDFVGKCYGHETKASTEAVRKVARLEGIFLDPIHSGKAMAGLIQLIRDGELCKGQSVVFLHTGGWP